MSPIELSWTAKKQIHDEKYIISYEALNVLVQGKGVQSRHGLANCDVNVNSFFCQIMLFPFQRQRRPLPVEDKRLLWGAGA